MLFPRLFFSVIIHYGFPDNDVFMKMFFQINPDINSFSSETNFMKRRGGLVQKRDADIGTTYVWIIYENDNVRLVL